MIVSASRRTDIPTFYSEWFYNRIKEGFLYVRNPMNAHQISRIDLVEYMGNVYPQGDYTFKVHSRRARKNYPKDSQQLNADLGEAILNAYENARVIRIRKIHTHGKNLQMCARN